MILLVTTVIVLCFSRYQTGLPGVQIRPHTVDTQFRSTSHTNNNLMVLMMMLMRIYRKFEEFCVKHYRCRPLIENVFQLKQIITKSARNHRETRHLTELSSQVRRFYQCRQQAANTCRNLLERQGGVDNVVLCRCHSGALKIGVTNTTEELHRFLLETIQLTPFLCSGHTGFYRCVQKNHMIWPHFTLNQGFQSGNALLRDTPSAALIGKGCIGEPVA